MTTASAAKLTFVQTCETEAKVILDGQNTFYTVSKTGTFYNIHWKGWPLPASYSSKNKAEIVESLEEIAALPCKPRPYSNIYYIPCK